MDPFYFHAVNVVLHWLASVALMHACDTAVFRDPARAFLAALLFAVHPVHTEAVAGIVGRADVLACLLFLLAFLSYDRCLCPGGVAGASPGCLLLSLWLGTCAMLVKETGVTVFGVCLLHDLFSLAHTHQEPAPAGGARSPLLALRPFLKRAALVVSYVTVLLGLRLWIMGGSLPLFSEQDNPASFSPYLLTSMGYCILLVHGLSRLSAGLPRAGAALTVCTLLLLLLFSWKTVKQNEVWLSREALFRSGVQTLPHNAKVHYNYANFLKDQGRDREAVHHYQTALRLYPRHASALNNLGTLTKDAAQAQAYYQRALRLNPQHHRALFNLGNLLRAQDRGEEAVALLRESIKHGPEFADAYSSLASLLADQDRLQEAEEVYQAGISSCPDSSDLHNNYGVFLVDTGEWAWAQVLAATGQADEAEQLTRQLEAEQPGCVECFRLLSAIYGRQERHDKALDAIDRALQLRPQDPKVTSELFFTRGNQLREQNLLDKAFESYKAAVELNPEQAQAWMNMGGIQHIQGDYVAARAFYGRALRLVPHSRLLRENLAKLDRLEKRLQEAGDKEDT
nr:unnamed protein product [Sorex araneus]